MESGICNQQDESVEMTGHGLVNLTNLKQSGKLLKLAESIKIRSKKSSKIKLFGWRGGGGNISATTGKKTDSLTNVEHLANRETVSSVAVAKTKETTPPSGLRDLSSRISQSNTAKFQENTEIPSVNNATSPPDGFGCLTDSRSADSAIIGSKTNKAFSQSDDDVSFPYSTIGHSVPTERNNGERTEKRLILHSSAKVEDTSGSGFAEQVFLCSRDVVLCSDSDEGSDRLGLCSASADLTDRGYCEDYGCNLDNKSHLSHNGQLECDCQGLKYCTINDITGCSDCGCNSKYSPVYNRRNKATRSSSLPSSEMPAPNPTKGSVTPKAECRVIKTTAPNGSIVTRSSQKKPTSGTTSSRAPPEKTNEILNNRFVPSSKFSNNATTTTKSELITRTNLYRSFKNGNSSVKLTADSPPTNQKLATAATATNKGAVTPATKEQWTSPINRNDKLQNLRENVKPAQNGTMRKRTKSVDVGASNGAPKAGLGKSKSAATNGSTNSISGKAIGPAKEKSGKSDTLPKKNGLLPQRNNGVWSTLRPSARKEGAGATNSGAKKVPTAEKDANTIKSRILEKASSRNPDKPLLRSQSTSSNILNQRTRSNSVSSAVSTSSGSVARSRPSPTQTQRAGTRRLQPTKSSKAAQGSEERNKEVTIEEVVVEIMSEERGLIRECVPVNGERSLGSRNEESVDHERTSRVKAELGGNGERSVRFGSEERGLRCVSRERDPEYQNSERNLKCEYDERNLMNASEAKTLNGERVLANRLERTQIVISAEPSLNLANGDRNLTDINCSPGIYTRDQLLGSSAGDVLVSGSMGHSDWVLIGCGEDSSPKLNDSGAALVGNSELSLPELIMATGGVDNAAFSQQSVLGDFGNRQSNDIVLPVMVHLPYTQYVSGLGRSDGANCGSSTIRGSGDGVCDKAFRRYSAEHDFGRDERRGFDRKISCSAVERLFPGGAVPRLPRCSLDKPGNRITIQVTNDTYAVQSEQGQSDFSTVNRLTNRNQVPPITTNGNAIDRPSRSNSFNGGSVTTECRNENRSVIYTAPTPMHMIRRRVSLDHHPRDSFVNGDFVSNRSRSAVTAPSSPHVKQTRYQTLPMENKKRGRPQSDFIKGQNGDHHPSLHPNRYSVPIASGSKPAPNLLTVAAGTPTCPSPRPVTPPPIVRAHVLYSSLQSDDCRGGGGGGGRADSRILRVKNCLKRSVSQPMNIEKVDSFDHGSIADLSMPEDAHPSDHVSSSVSEDDLSARGYKIGSRLTSQHLLDLINSVPASFADALWDHVTLDPEELAFKAGDLVRVLDNSHSDWWWGVVDNRAGWFPTCFVRLKVNQDTEPPNNTEQLLAEVAHTLLQQEQPNHHTPVQPKSANCDSQGHSSVSRKASQGHGSSTGSWEQMRTNVIREVVMTERDFVQNLSDVIQGYVRQVQKRPDMFAEERVQRIFGNIEGLYAFQARFLCELETSIDWKEPHRSQVGFLFEKHREGFEMYSEYCNNHPNAIAELQELYLQPKYAHFFEACRLLQDMIGISLDGFLLTPVQKICKYPLQLAELLKYTPTTHPDCERVGEALNTMRGVAMYINERKRRMECLEKLAVWQAGVQDWEGPHLLDTSSELIHNGEVTKISSNGWSKEVSLFLFDHLLVVCKRDLLKRDVNCFKCRVAMDTSELMDVADGRNLQTNTVVRNSFRLYCALREKWLLFSTRSPDDKAVWLHAFFTERERVRRDRALGFIVTPQSRRAAIASAGSKRNSATRSSKRPKSKSSKPLVIRGCNVPSNLHFAARGSNLPLDISVPVVAPKTAANPAGAKSNGAPAGSNNHHGGWFLFGRKKIGVS